jgi:hypothetical protein
LGRAWHAWVALLDRKEPPTALALVRIALALVALVDALDLWRQGLVDVLWSRPPVGYATDYAPWFDLGGPTLWAIGVVALAAVALGLATRIACVVAVLVSAQLSSIAPMGESGVDFMFRIAFAILALSRCNARWSIDALIARALRRPMPTEIPAWPRYLLMMQLVWIYFSGGQNKASASWGPHGGFTALANAMSDPHAGRFDPAWIGAIYPLTRIATALTMAFELGAPLYLWFYYCAETRDRPGRLRHWCNRYRLRWIWLGLGVAFELGIAVTLKLGDFPYGMLALFPVLLMPEELQRRNTVTPAKLASSPS